MLDLNRLEKYRDEILKAEIVSMLTLWGKILPSTGINKTDKSIDNINWESELEDKEIIFKDLDDRELKSFKIVENFLDNWRDWRNKNSSDYILQILYGISESLNSGIDKGSPKEDVKVKPERWLSNAFGSFKRKIIYLEKEESEINNIINEIKSKVLYTLDKENISLYDLEEVRNKIKNLFSGLLSDDRFPINDVSLWEQTFMPTSMFKALLADYVLTHSDFNNIPDRQKVKWRILGIQYDKMGLAEKGFKLASIKWYRDITKKIDEGIKRLLEIEYPIGNEIYRDETGIYFIVGEDLGEDSSYGEIKLSQGLEKLEEKIFKIFERCLKGEAYPYISLTKASRGLMNLSKLLENAKENFLKIKYKKSGYNLDLEKKAIGICPICKVRLVYEEDKEKNNKPPICEVCDSRIHHSQVSDWLKDINGETIWIDEIKDKNNRVAYISLKFELEDWLNGDLLNSLLVRNEEYKKYLLEIKKFILLFFSKFYILNIDVRNIDNEINKIIQLLKDNSLSKNKKRELGQKKSDLVTQKRKIETFLKLIQEIKNSNWWEKSINAKHNFTGFTNKTIDGIIEELNKIILDINISKIENPFLKLSPDAYNGCKINDETFDDFINQIFFSSILGTKWEEWIKQTSLNNKIDWKNEKIKWEEFTDEDDAALDILATLLLQFLLRKNPSPARLRRIWESTQEFFENIHKNLDEDLKIPEWRKKRLVWEVNLDKDNKLDKSRELEGSGLLFWAEKIGNKAKIYLISSIEDFIEKFVDKNNKDLLLEKLNSENVNLNEIKQHLKDFKISLKQYSESKNRGEGEVLITLKKDSLSQIHSYKPYSLITDTSPTNYQLIIPTSFLPNFMDEVIKRYNENFKYVYGKLPIHIGIVVSDYKKPVYVNLKALRNIRRDINSDELWIEKNKNEFQRLQSQKMSNEVNEDESKNYYALYFNNPDRKDYQFFIKPDNNWKYWISTIDKFPLGSKIKMIPNTFDFEFLDTNARRNDIYYESSDKGYKRAVKIKSNRPYEIEIYWDKFKKFKDLFADKANTAKMHKLVGLFYEKLQDYDEKYKPLLASAIVNILELRKNQNFLKDIQIIFDLNRENDIQKELIEKLDKEKLKLFIDMFEFWHTALKEV